MQAELEMRRIHLLSLLKSAREGEHPFVTFCRARNHEFKAPPGVMLPESTAAAMQDFILWRVDSLQLQHAYNATM